MKKEVCKRITALLFILGIFLLTPEAKAQCAMCRANVESNMQKPENKIGAGLNTGILYLMSIPYLIGGIACFFWFRKKQEIKRFLNSEPE
jgi:hypothetical protein